MAQTGRQHWRRAVMCTFAAIFVVSLLAGLLGSVTRGALAIAPAPGHRQGSTTARSRADGSATGESGASASASLPVSPDAAAEGQGALLQLSDLPAGWVSGAAPGAPARVSPWSAPLARCVGVSKRAAALAPTKVESPDFTSATKELAVEDSVSVYPSAAAAQTEYAAMANTRTAECMNAVAGPRLEASMQGAAQSGTTIGRVSFRALPAGASAQHESGFTVSIPVSSGGRVLVITSTQVDFVRGALLHQITLNGNGTTFPPTLEIELLTAAQSRG
jgi:hypothetical protein